MKCLCLLLALAVAAVWGALMPRGDRLAAGAHQAHHDRTDYQARFNEDERRNRP